MIYREPGSLAVFYDLAPPPPAVGKYVSLSQSSRVSPVQLFDGRGGGGKQVI
jgi:hypothetical protein